MSTVDLRELKNQLGKRAQSCRSRLIDASGRWHILRLSGDIVDRARLPFPGEPIRTLDALHVASAVVGRTALPDLALLSLDERVRTVAQQLGFKVIPR